MARYNPHYDKKLIFKYLLSFLTIVFLCKVTVGVAFVLMPLMLLFAMAQGRDESVLFIFLTAVFVMVAGWFFVPKTMLLVATQKVLMVMSAFLLGLRSFGRANDKKLTPILSLLPYLVFAIIPSQMGWCPIISNLKLLLFVLVFFGFYGCSVKIMSGRAAIRNLRSMLLAFAAFFIVGSVLVIPLPAISILSAEAVLQNPDLQSFFCGVTSHPQTLGPLMAGLGVLLFADWMFSIQRMDKLYVLLLVLCPFLIYKTASRTAMGSFLAGMVFVAYFAARSRFVKRGWRQKLIQLFFLFLFIGACGMLVVPRFREGIGRFVVKYNRGSRVELNSKSILSSRQSKIDLEMENWRRSPWIGNGFQVSVDMDGKKVTRLREALSAPVEKGTWIYAVLEEGGIFGLILFVMFGLVSIVLMVRRKAYVGAAMVVMLLMINMGEFVVFSMTALGGPVWFMVFLGVMFDHKRMQQNRVAVNRMNIPPPLPYGRY